MLQKNDKGMVIGTKKESLWTQVLEAAKARIISLKNALIVDEAMIKLAQDKILLEKRK